VDPNNPVSPNSPSGPGATGASSGNLPSVSAVSLGGPVGAPETGVVGGYFPPASPLERPALPPAAPVDAFVPPSAGEAGLAGQPEREGGGALIWGLVFPMFALAGLRRRRAIWTRA
jgi:hypothetical protein